MIIRRAASAAVLLAVLALLAACTATIDGAGHDAAAPSSRSGRSPAITGFPSPSASVPPSRSAPVNRLERTPVSTTLGDPVIADICSVVAPRAFVASGRSVVLDPVQYLPGCTVDVDKGGATQIFVFASAVSDLPGTGPHTTTMLSGQTVYKYPYEPAIGNCEHEIVLSGALVQVSVYAVAIRVANRALDCGLASTMTKQVAAGIASHTIRPLDLTSTVTTDLEVCAVVRASTIHTLSDYYNPTSFVDDSFGAGCLIDTPTADLSVNVVVDSGARPPDSHRVVLDGHPLYESGSLASGRCLAYSEQKGLRRGGRLELVFATSRAAPRISVPNLCEQNAAAADFYLNRAGLT